MDENSINQNLVNEKISSEAEIKSDYELVSVKNKLNPIYIIIISALVILTITGVMIYLFFFA